MTSRPNAEGRLPRIWRFLQKPWQEKAKWARFRWSAALAGIPKLTRLPFGVWWVVRSAYIDEMIRQGRFEKAELNFLRQYLRPGMTVLDLGAHNGFYTLLASKCVFPNGRVFAFEPSPRERRALIQHSRLNRCRNVTIEDVAVGKEAGEADLFVIQGKQTGCNSLRHPASDVPPSWIPSRVQVISLDEWINDHLIGSVDFVKVDVEGGELDVLLGAKALLERVPRPLFLVEVQDMRTVQWGYPAKEIIVHLQRKGFKWFRLLPGGSIREFTLSDGDLEDNFLACPKEREPELRKFANSGNHDLKKDE
jgi:FkbM family methyltransferase